jgi:endonuclease-8
MPEGDTIFRTAVSLRKWIEGREVTAARAQTGRAPLQRVVGTVVERIETQGKHLLIRFSSGDVLHTHMRMTGAWHVYPTGASWKRPAWQARVILECGERTAVCFNAPVVELLRPGGAEMHGALQALGPDALSPDFDVEEVMRRAAARPPHFPLGELLLDQQVLAGLGNIYRCESLFAARHHPWTPQSAVDAGALRELVLTGVRLIRANVAGGTTIDRRFGGVGSGGELAAGPASPWVYRRAGRACRRCRATIQHGRLGRDARSVYWCPGCQPEGT